MKLLPKLALSTILLGLTDCASSLENIVSKTPVRQEITIQKEAPQPLYVNPNKEHYIIEKSREEGEKDIYELTTTEELEEAWAFVEFFDGRNLWYENGLEVEGEKERICPDKKPLIEIVKDKDKIKQLSIYHFHPADMDRNYDHSQTPSLLDFKGFLSLLGQFDRYDKNLAGKVDFKIIVSTGIYTVKFNNDIFYNKEAGGKIARTIHNICITRLLSVTDEHVEFNYSQSNRENFAGVNKRFAEKFDGELMYFGFEFKH